MADAPPFPVERVRRLILVSLSSDQNGEALNALHALRRLLQVSGSDIHALANSIGPHNGAELSEAEMQKLYDAGYQNGLQAAENKFYGDADFLDQSGEPDWHTVAKWCQRHDDRLREKEAQFVADMASRTVYRQPSEKQEQWLRAIFLRLGGRLT
jgi:hypothetical protein